MSEQNVFDILQERGFLYQVTDEVEMRRWLGEQNVTFYIGFDPTADSLHLGSMVPLMAMAHMQRCGHRPIALLGRGTTMVGDPSGKTEMRKMLTPEQIQENGRGFVRQFERFISFGEGRALLLDNADWLLPLNYVNFLRDIGSQFSVNRMLSMEAYRIRMESTGLSFLEFNYMLLQAYDFLVLAQEHGCLLQMGGQDQWGNIVAGIDLVRRKMNRQAYGATFPLLTNSSGEKFGKTVAGAVWLDENRTPVFEMYQFWRNVEDGEVAKLLGLFTFLPMDEVRRLGALPPPLLNRAKEVLGYEVTALVHGREKAEQAYLSAVRQFGAADPEGTVATSSAIRDIRVGDDDIIPRTVLPLGRFVEGVDITQLLLECGLTASKAEARRLVEQGGVTFNDRRIDKAPCRIDAAQLVDGQGLLRLGKKKYHRVVTE